MSINLVVLVGRIGKPTDIKETKFGYMYTYIVATDTADQKGEKHTEWHKVIRFSKEAYPSYLLDTGQLVQVEGSLSHRSYEDKEGRKQWVTEIVAKKVKSLGPKKSLDNSQKTFFQDEY